MCSSVHLPIQQIFFNFPSLSTLISFSPLLFLSPSFLNSSFSHQALVPLIFFRGSFLSMQDYQEWKDNHRILANEHKVIYFITYQNLSRMCLEICSHFALELKLLVQSQSVLENHRRFQKRSTLENLRRRGMEKVCFLGPS